MEKEEPETVGAEVPSAALGPREAPASEPTKEEAGETENNSGSEPSAGPEPQLTASESTRSPEAASPPTSTALHIAEDGADGRTADLGSSAPGGEGDVARDDPRGRDVAVDAESDAESEAEFVDAAPSVPLPEDEDDDRGGDAEGDSDYHSADGGRDGGADEDRREEGNAARDRDDGRADDSGDGDSDPLEEMPTSPLRGPDVGFAFQNHLRRQAMLMVGALKDAGLRAEGGGGEPFNVDTLQRRLERFVFNPPAETPAEHAEVRFNFYPPFQTPKAIASYHVFAVTAPIPASCKANRSGSALLRGLRETTFFKHLPKWRVGVAFDDGLGDEVAPVGELREEVKLTPLRDDVSRLQWAKARGEHVRFFSYPSMHFPPRVGRMLMETLLQPFTEQVDPASGAEREPPAPCVSDEELRAILDPLGRMSGEEAAEAARRRRAAVALAVRYTAQLELMQRVFREPSSVKKMQEVLHHTLHHGFVAVVRDATKVNLSNYSTYHGVTYVNPLNNCTAARLLEGADKEDYVLDTVYLFLVLTWQTLMGMWQQAVDETTVEMYAAAFRRERRRIYSLSSVTDISKAVVDLLMDGDRLAAEMRHATPNFVTQSQISNYRHFLMERANVPALAAPFLPSDFVPLTYRQSPPLLWDHVYLLQLAFFLTAHGGYLWEPPEGEPETPASRVYCPCNLCSPHRMPCDNAALHNETLAIGTFEIRGADGRAFKLTPELWANAYLDRFVPADFHPFVVHHYAENRSTFTKTPLTACVTDSPEILDLIRRIRESREEFLATRGKGVYKDPQTGETLNTSAADDPAAHAPRSRQLADRSGAPTAAAAAAAARGAPLPTPAPRAGGRALTAAEAAGALRPEQSRYGILPDAHGAAHGGREGAGRGAPAGPRGDRAPLRPRGAGGAGGPARADGRRLRRRNSRKSGYVLPGGGFGGGLHRGGGGGGRAGAGGRGGADGSAAAAPTPLAEPARPAAHQETRAAGAPEAPLLARRASS
ncbi:100 kDa protein [Turkey adenovirus 1]|uniref:Shutoff protein n=1 Tax=Turkey adenovirus 1 TaxID=878329 RepID=E0YC71_9ADEN|nr:100 kDa protein [Turkey adenovirus 1]ADM53804.1 100 kDa protein [Turkey adenovirus 1]